MARIAYTGTHPDGSTFGGWFESDTAERFEGNEQPEDSYALPEELYLTEDGSWILNQFVVANPDRSTYTLVSDQEAHTWLKENDYPEAAKKYFERPKGGRPQIGERLITTAPARMHNQIAALSEMYAEDMSNTVRRLLREALAHREAIGMPGSRDHLIAGH
ncbi:hypothetical protein ACFW2V_12295 [Streptomyces sp. NPDC058947]|uniref:hypothetical protein n=1 Tax=Streptomyces sp. NPDC058947 TaxID=3346675 RepID=UPI0036B65CC0